MNDRLFVGCYPTGWVFADKRREVQNDYARCGYQSYKTLDLKLEPDCPPDLRVEIEAIAERHRARRGQRYSVAGNLSVILGE